jgi:hypothetical protein
MWNTFRERTRGISKAFARWGDENQVVSGVTNTVTVGNNRLMVQHRVRRVLTADEQPTGTSARYARVPGGNSVWCGATLGSLHECDDGGSRKICCRMVGLVFVKMMCDGEL